MPTKRCQVKHKTNLLPLVIPAKLILKGTRNCLWNFSKIKPTQNNGSYKILSIKLEDKPVSAVEAKQLNLSWILIVIKEFRSFYLKFHSTLCQGIPDIVFEIHSLSITSVFCL